MPAVLFIVLLLLTLPARAEEACPEYRNGCVPLEHFQCSDIADKDKEIQRLCYNEPARYMIIWLLNRQGSYTPYNYCDIGPIEITSLKSSPVPYAYYIAHIRSKRNGDHGPFDCRDHPVPATFN
jgi:hypothetical protein